MELLLHDAYQKTLPALEVVVFDDQTAYLEINVGYTFLNIDLCRPDVFKLFEYLKERLRG